MKRIYPEYWCAFAVLFGARYFMHSIPFEHWYSPLTDLLLLENIGLPLAMEGINYPCWYLSVLLFGGTAVYLLLRVLSEKTYNVIAGLIIAITCLIFVIHSENIEQWGTIYRVFYLPFWRGMADMMVGTLLYKTVKPNKTIIRFTECLSLAGVAVLLFCDGPYFDYIAAVMMFIFVWTLTSEHSLFGLLADNIIIRDLDKYQYSMYVNHLCIILLFKYFAVPENLPLGLTVILLITAICILAVFDVYITGICTEFLKRKGETITVNGE